MSISYSDAIAIIKAHKAAASSDIVAVLKSTGRHAYTAEVHEFCNESNMDLETILRLPQKQVKRFTQFAGALIHRNIKDFDYTHARILLAMREAGSHNLARDAVVSLAAGVILPSANTRGITRAQINSLFSSRHGLSTVETKVSNSTGRNGFYQATGMTYGKPGQVNREFSLNRSHPLVGLFFDVMDRATESQLREMAGTEDG